jgi:hypothetical protein
MQKVYWLLFNNQCNEPPLEGKWGELSAQGLWWARATMKPVRSDDTMVNTLLE